MSNKSSKKATTKDKKKKAPSIENGNFLVVTDKGQIRGYAKKFDDAVKKAGNELSDEYEYGLKHVFIFEAKLLVKVEPNKPIVTRVDDYGNPVPSALNQIE